MNEKPDNSTVSSRCKQVEAGIRLVDGRDYFLCNRICLRGMSLCIQAQRLLELVNHLDEVADDGIFSTSSRQRASMHFK